jgi:hypothetical protein
VDPLRQTLQHRPGLHSAIGYLAPADKLVGRKREIFAARALKLSVAGEMRKIRRIESDTRMVA